MSPSANRTGAHDHPRIRLLQLTLENSVYDIMDVHEFVSSFYDVMDVHAFMNASGHEVHSGLDVTLYVLFNATNLLWDE